MLRAGCAYFIERVRGAEAAAPPRQAVHNTALLLLSKGSFVLEISNAMYMQFCVMLYCHMTRHEPM